MASVRHEWMPPHIVPNTRVRVKRGYGRTDSDGRTACFSTKHDLKVTSAFFPIG